jgi:hypothetical protein
MDGAALFRSLCISCRATNPPRKQGMGANPPTDLIHDIPVIHRLHVKDSAWRDSEDGVSLRIRGQDRSAGNG